MKVERMLDREWRPALVRLLGAWRRPVKDAALEIDIAAASMDTPAEPQNRIVSGRRVEPQENELAARQGVAGSILTPNEARQRYDPNLPIDPAGDERYAPNNLAATGSQASGSTADDAGRPPRGEENV
jgi:hypothetical protein